MGTRTFQEIKIADIELSGDNKRRIDEKADDFKAMVESVKAAGVVDPVQVRPHPKKKGKFELRAGERRFRTARAAGLLLIPAIVNEGQDDRSAVLTTLTENQHRKDLAPIEEAQQIALTVERFGGDVKAVAAQIGKSEKWVRVRTAIVTNLADGWRKIFFADKKKGRETGFESWTLSHMTLIARLPQHLQKELLDNINNGWNPERISAVDLEEMIQKNMHTLSSAKWNLDDETLVPAAGSCSMCPKRTGHQPLLWFDSDEQAKAGDQCLDLACWQSKHLAWLDRRHAEWRAKHSNLVLALSNPTMRRETDQIAEKLGAPLAPWQYTTCSKTTKGAVPAMYVNNKGAGQLTFIKIRPSDGPGRASKVPFGRPTPLKERQAALDAKRWAQVLIDLKEKVQDTEVPGITYKDHITAVMTLTAGFGNQALWQQYAHSLDDRPNMSRKEIETLSKSKNQAKGLAFLWASLKPTLKRMLTYNVPITRTPKGLKQEAEWIAELIGVDLTAMFKDVCSRKGFTVPKSWAGLNADGTPKGEKPKAKKQKVAKGKKAKAAAKQTCRMCGCTQGHACIGKDGQPCHWVEDDLCSACAEAQDLPQEDPTEIE